VTSAMSSSIVGARELPSSQYDLSTYWGRVRHSVDIVDPRCVRCMIFVISDGTNIPLFQHPVNLPESPRCSHSPPGEIQARGDLPANDPRTLARKEGGGRNLAPRHRNSRLPPLSHVLLRLLEPSRHSGNAHAKPDHPRSPWLADRQPDPQRSHQHLQREQVLAVEQWPACDQLPPRRERFLRRRCGTGKGGAEGGL